MNNSVAPERADHLRLALVVGLTLLARVIPAVVCGVEVSDLSTYRNMAAIVLRNEDIYEVRNIFPYTPLSLFLPLLALRLSAVSHLPFHIVMKLFPLLGDLGTAALVYLLARRRWNSRCATVVGVGFALNPVSILITGFHGNIMPLSVFFAFWAYYLLEVGNRNRTYVLSALALGIGIGLRSWPVLLLPFLLRRGVLTWRQRFVYLMLAGLPSVATLAPYMLVNFEGIRRELFDYKSTPDFGWVGIRRNIWFFQTGDQNLPSAPYWLSRSRFYFLAACSVVVLLAWVRPYVMDTAGWIATALLLNYTLVGGLAAQYLMWVVPFLVLRPYFSLAFSLVAGGAIATFYLTWHPYMLLGRYPPPIAYTKQQIFAWNLAFLMGTWGLGAGWVVWFVGRVIRVGLLARADNDSRAATLQVETASRAEPEERARSRRRWATVASCLLVSCVAVAVALEVLYLRRSRPAPVLPATVQWRVSRQTETKLGAALGLAVHPSGDIYVADVARRAHRVSPTGEFVQTWDLAQLEQPTDVAIGSGGEVYVLDTGGGIYRLQADGTIVQQFSLVPLGAYSPRGLAVDSSRGRFYVSDTGNGRLLVVGMDGTSLGQWGGGTDLHFDLAWGVALDTQGNVYVVEQGPSRITKFSPAGNVLTQWVVKGSVSDVAVGQGDRVYISGADKAHIWVYDTEGRVLGQTDPSLLNQRARALAVVQPGDVVLAMEESIARFSVELPGSDASPPSTSGTR